MIKSLANTNSTLKSLKSKVGSIQYNYNPILPRKKGRKENDYRMGKNENYFKLTIFFYIEKPVTKCEVQIFDFNLPLSFIKYKNVLIIFEKLLQKPVPLKTIFVYFLD